MIRFVLVLFYICAILSRTPTSAGFRINIISTSSSLFQINHNLFLEEPRSPKELVARRIQHAGNRDHTKLPLDVAMIKLNSASSNRTCLTVEGGEGGLANTVAFINIALNFSMSLGVPFAFPSVKPPVHGAGDDFVNLFGDDNTCNSTVQVAFAHADCGSRQCYPHGFYVDTSEFAERLVSTCGCDRLVLLQVPHMEHNNDFSRTRPVFYDRYWKTHADKVLLPHTDVEIPGSTPPTVVVHIRLGDVARFKAKSEDVRPNYGKHAPIEFFAQCLEGLHSLVPLNNTRLVIVTESPDHQEIHQLRKNIADLGGPAPLIYGSELKAVDAFEMFTHADVLVFGGSGFSRLAAVLAKNTSARIALSNGRKPLSYLPNTSLFDWNKKDVRTGVQNISRGLSFNEALGHFHPSSENVLQASPQDMAVDETSILQLKVRTVRTGSCLLPEVAAVAPEANEVLEVPAAEVSASSLAFEKLVRNTSRPVVLRATHDGLELSQFCDVVKNIKVDNAHKWSDGYQKLSEGIVPIRRLNTNGSHGYTFEFKDWVTLCDDLLANDNVSLLHRTATNTSPTYAKVRASQQLLQILPSFSMPYQRLAAAVAARKERPYLWIGAPGSKTPLHIDTSDNIAMQVSGTKTWHLYSPRYHHELELGPEAESILSDPSSRVNQCPGKQQSFYSNRSMLPGRAKPLEDYIVAKMHAGDSLYLPGLWGHFVENTDTSIMVNYWLYSDPWRCCGH